MPDTPDLSISCLVWGDPRDHSFVVKLPGTDTVSYLKEVIKEKMRPQFDNVPAAHLDIYRTSERAAGWEDDEDDEGLMEALANESHSKLLPGRELSKVFFNRPLVPSGIQILVKPPSTFTAPQATISINCLVVGDTRNHIFTVDLAGTQKVSHLKDAIKEKKKPYFDNVPADHLEIFRTSFPNDGELEDKLRNLNFNEPLQPTSLLANIFTDLPVENLHIVVRPIHEIPEPAGVNEEQRDILTKLNEYSFPKYHHTAEHSAL